MKKAKYQVCINAHVRYICVTTTRSEEDMIDIF